MRTTVTLDPDVVAQLRSAMRTRRVSFKEALNQAVRAGLGAPKRAKPYRLKPVAMGESKAPLDKALSLAAAIEDEALLGKLALRK